MTRAPLLALCGLAALLAATVAVEFDQPPPAPASAALVPAAPAAAIPVPAVRMGDAGQIGSWVATILARPLFSRDRRLADAPAAIAVVAESLPRLTGITVSPAGRRAIFASPGSKPLVASPGDRVAGFTVQAIEPGGVTMAGPNGPRVLQPSFEGPPHAAAGTANPVATVHGATPELLGQLLSGRLSPNRARFPEAEFNRLAPQPAQTTP